MSRAAAQAFEGTPEVGVRDGIAPLHVHVCLCI